MKDVPITNVYVYFRNMVRFIKIMERHSKPNKTFDPESFIWSWNIPSKYKLSLKLVHIHGFYTILINPSIQIVKPELFNSEITFEKLPFTMSRNVFHN